MSVTLKAAALLGIFASSALAHGTVSGIRADGVYSEGWQLSYYYDIQNGVAFPPTPGWYAENLDNGFISPDNYTDPNIICHKNARNANITATVKAGGTIDFLWTPWPASHIGPVFTYVANCDGNCSAVDKTTLEWVKIDEGGINFDTQTWATADLIANNNTWTTKVPSTLAAGQYVFRHEIIAMHGAEAEDGAQNYPQCLNIEITGSGTDKPEGTLGTKLYTPTEPGILFNPYTTLTNYTIPGPPLYSGASTAVVSAVASSGAATSAASSSAAATSATSAATVTPPSSAAAPASTSTAPGASDVAPSSSSSALTSAPSACKRRRHARDIVS
ncbi:hypothetical protein NA57DRAFT_34258 [Rhizodiscina lignyota]|uniref:Auxiliary Activity family 9 catalytic domain-containing protein n=1 Tax=Rhizodiscina lignyota TaxID=1504668 RepID=A0A9P4IGQ0_9PEZI|nr:hypothetical protein NA57DRAFT_34258 [Rhizodiscina lignyota]